MAGIDLAHRNTQSHLMLLLLIPIAWLAVVTVLVAVCRAAGRAEAPRSAAAESPPQVIHDGLVVWDPVAARALRAHYASRRVRGNGRWRELSGAHARTRELPTRAPGVRQAS
jgi:uncharacterized membrane protein